MSKALERILFTHDDLDGAGCRVIFELAFGKGTKGIDFDVWNCSNGGIDSKVREAISTEVVDKDTVVWFGDISAGREALNEIQNVAKTVWVVDHHRTNFFVTHELRDPSHAIIVPENEFGQLQSGTSLLFQKLSEMVLEPYSGIDKGAMTNGGPEHQEFIGLFVDTVRSYDTYEWKQTNNLIAKRLNTLFYLLGMERFCKMYLRLLRDPFYKGDLIGTYDVQQFVDAKLEAEQKMIDTFGVDRIIDTTVRGYRTALLIGSCYPANFSELGNQFLTKHPEFDVIAQFTLSDGGTFGFRAVRDDIDIGKDIAAPIGGGGHPKAAGAPLSQELKEIFQEYLIAEMNNRPCRP